MKGAIEDPILDRAVSATGFTTSEELQVQGIETQAALVDLFLRANFEEPKEGWPKRLRIPRPNDEAPEEEQEEVKLPLASASDIVSFTESSRQEW